MKNYRIVKKNQTSDELTGRATELRRAITMAQEYSKWLGVEYVVEKVEHVWPRQRRKPQDNAIHCSIRDESFD